MAVRRLTSSRALNRALPWIAGAILLVGAIAFWQSTVRANGITPSDPSGPVPNSSTPKTVPLSPEARNVVVQFIKTAVMRRDLDQAWKISGPQIRQGMTLEEWRTGTIPVVPYPNAAVERSPVKITWSYPEEAGLEVVLEPKAGSSEKPQLFFVNVIKQRTGAKAKWVVDYWAPYAPPRVPASG